MRRVRRSFLHDHSVRSAHTARAYMRSGRGLLNSNHNVNDTNSSTPDSQQQADIGCQNQNIEITSSFSRSMTENHNINNASTANDPPNPLSSNILSESDVVRVLDHIEQLNEENVDDNSKYGRILRSIREVISCCACFSSESIMKECTNGHLICQNCFLTLRQDERPQCPTCRASLYSDSRKALIAQKVLSELPDFCVDCGAQMLHKALAGHRLNTCTKRRVACGLSAIGCEWTGTADQYDGHYVDCLVKKQLAERPLTDNLDMLLTRFKKREQSMRETFHCFSNMLRHLESHELQTVTVTLAAVSTTENTIHYRSDHFHVNQSRWTAEIIMNFSHDSSPVITNSERATSHNHEAHEANTDTPEGSAFEQSISVDTIDYSSSTATPQPQVVRRRRWYHGANIRHHPYNSPYQMPVLLTGSANNTAASLHESAIPAMQGASTPGQISTPTNETRWLGDIHYRMLKENSPGIGRRAYAFVLLQIKVPETGIQIYARPQLHPYRFSARGDHTSTFTIHPIRWRYISTLKELTKYRLVQAEFVIARRIVDEHVET